MNHSFNTEKMTCVSCGVYYGEDHDEDCKMNLAQPSIALAEMRQEEAETRAKWREVALMTYSECPCGCGLKNDVCDAQAERIRIENEKLQF